MEIETVEAVPLRRELDERFANAQKWINSREYCLVMITTTDGTVGWGKCWGPIAGNREIIERTVVPWLVGKDPRNVETIHDDLLFKLRSSYHSYIPASVVSGVDIALWDLRGKAIGESVSRLLGGRRRDRIQSYVTGHFWPPVDSFDEPHEAVVAEATGHIAAGFDALKIKIGLRRHFGWGSEYDVELVRTVREAVGNDVRLMADANHAYDLGEARRVARGLADLDIYIFSRNRCRPNTLTDMDG